MREPSHSTPPEADWEKLRPTLDSAMHELKETDREAVLLRYFENRPFAEVGAKLRLTENAARMRVERAVEKLRALLAKRGIATGAALASVISANAIQTAPGNLAATLATASLASAGSGALLFAKFMTATNLKLSLGALATAAVVVALIGQQQSQKALRAENQSLTAQIAQLKADNADLSNRISAADSSASLTDDQRAELLKLRGEVTQLRAIKRGPVAVAPPARTNLPAIKQSEIVLKARFVSIPEEDGPEFEAAWTTAGASTSLLSEQQLGTVISELEAKKADLLNEGEVTTLSGRQAEFQVVETVPINGTNIDVGPILNVLPFYSSDSSIFTLTLAATLNQLTGDASQPGLVTTQMSNQVSVVPGQTVALRAKMPAGGWLPDSKDVPDGPRELLVLVTPTLIDTVGNRIQSSSQSDASRARAIEKMNESREGMLALIQFADQNGNQFPTDLEQASRYAGDGSMNQIETDFEFVDPGSITNIANPSATIVLKEKQAWQTPNGGWFKAYGFADGHAEIHKEANGNFDDFENQHTISALASQ